MIGNPNIHENDFVNQQMAYYLLNVSASIQIHFLEKGVRILHSE